MIAFAGMLVRCASEAGMPVPEDPEKYDLDAFPHWNVFTTVQLGASMPTPNAHWENAKIIAAIPEKQIRKVTFAQLLKKGLHVST